LRSVSLLFLRFNHIRFLMQSQNSIGGLSHQSGGHVNEPFKLVVRLVITI
jgi:hypothetical protein